MRSFLGRFIPRTTRKQLTNFLILSKKYGQYHSIKHFKPLGGLREPIPWYTYPAIEYLENLDFSASCVFEFGSGYSTLWWSMRAESVLSVEHDQDWHASMIELLPQNGNILLREEEASYVTSIKETRAEYDIIIIDGRLRHRCAGMLYESLKPGGLVILDNSDWHRETAKYIRDSMDLIQVDFHGFGPINNYTWTTSLFLSRTCKIYPLEGVQPHYSVGALRQ